MTLYEKKKKHFKSNPTKITLATLNTYFVKHLGFSITKEQAFTVCEELSQGHNVHNGSLFRYYYSKTKVSNPKHVVIKGLKLILLYVKGECPELALNAFLTYQYLPKYQLFLKETSEIKEIHHAILEPQKEDQNVIYQLSEEYHKFCENIENKRYRLTSNQLRYYKNYEKIFTDQKDLQKFYRLFKNNIRLSKNYKNELYECMIVFVERRKEEFLSKDFTNLSLMDEFKGFVHQYYYSPDPTLKKYYDSVLTLGDNSYFLKNIKDYLKNPIPFSQFCTKIQRKEEEVIQLLGTLNQPELLKEIKEWIQKEKEETKEQKEQDYTSFVHFMKQDLDTSVTPKDFTLTHYYALTNIPLDQMIAKLIHSKEDEVAFFLKQVYILNQEKLGKVKLKKYKELTNDEIQLIRTQMNQEHFPNITGVFEDANRYYQHDLLENFTKEHFIQDLMQNKIYKK